MDKNDVWMLRDLVDAYNNGEIPENEKAYFAFYPTDGHRIKHLVWWMPYSELKGHSELRKIAEKLNHELWFPKKYLENSES